MKVAKKKKLPKSEKGGDKEEMMKKNKNKINQH